MPNPAQFSHGPFLTGCLFNNILSGIILTQTYIYYTKFPQDSKWIKCYVLTLFVLDTMSTIFDFTFLYNSLILHFGDANYLTRTTNLFSTTPVMTGIIACLVQLFFAWRIKVVTKARFPVIFIVTCALISCVGSIATTTALNVARDFSVFRNFQSIEIIWLATSALVNLAITSILVWNMRSQRPVPNVADGMVDRSMQVVIQTGLLTTTWAIADLVVFLANAQATHLIFNVPLSKFYVNMLMSSLNSRSATAEEGSTGLIKGSVVPDGTFFQLPELPNDLTFQGPGKMYETPGLNSDNPYGAEKEDKSDTDSNATVTRRSSVEIRSSRSLDLGELPLRRRSFTITS